MVPPSSPGFGLDPSSLAARHDLGARGRRRAERRNKQARRVRRARRLLATGIGVLVLFGLVLVVVGWSKVRHSTPGEYVDDGVSPDEPGYVALVEPTPTMLVASRDATGALSGVALLALHGEDEGGAVLVMPTAARAISAPLAEGETSGSSSSDDDTPISNSSTSSSTSTTVGQAGGDEATTLAAGYADGGLDALVGQVELMLNIAIQEAVELDDAGWASLVAPVNPVTVTLDRQVGDWPAGRSDLAADAVGPFLAARNDGESELARLSRQEDFWRAWLPDVAAAGPDAVPGEAEVGIGRFVRGLAAGDASVSSLPVEAADDVFEEQFLPVQAMMVPLVAQEIPYPQEPTPGSRIRVRLLNGTSERDLPIHAAAPLVAAGAEIGVAGNAESFQEPQTRLVYATPQQREAAEALQAALGIGVVEEEQSDEGIAPTEEGDRIDVTVILGADAPEAIGRLETTD
jgi:LytR cell envelope-related transcriptional attenuator